MAVALTELVVGDEPSAWAAGGFAVDGDRTTIGSVTVRLAGASGRRGIIGWTLAGLDPEAADGGIDGLPTTLVDEHTTPSPVEHANGTAAFDHLVLITPDLDRTTGALEAVGIDARRSRDVGTPDAPRRQVFFWLGEPILELVGPAEPTGDGPSRFYGVACTVADIDATALALGERVGRVKDAVQPGRRITTLRHKDLDMSVPVAFMSSHVKPDDVPDA